jgi:hypothetical protein
MLPVLEEKCDEIVEKLKADDTFRDLTSQMLMSAVRAPTIKGVFIHGLVSIWSSCSSTKFACITCCLHRICMHHMLFALIWVFSYP